MRRVEHPSRWWVALECLSRSESLIRADSEQTKMGEEQVSYCTPIQSVSCSPVSRSESLIRMVVAEQAVSCALVFEQIGTSDQKGYTSSG